MKRAACVFLALCIALGLSGCVGYGVQYQCMGSAEEIAEIAVFDLRSAATDRFDETIKPVGYVDSGSYASFVEELEAFPFVDHLMLILAPSDPSFIYGGYVVRITYADGAYELIGSAGYQTQHSGGRLVGSSHYSCDNNRWDQFLWKYASSVL